MRNPVVVGERVYLRPYEKADADTVSEWYATEDETFMYRGRGPISPLAFHDWFTKMYKKQPPRDIEFVVATVTDDTAIGEVGVYDLDWVNRTGETGSFLGPGHRNQGYGPEAKHLLLEYCFDVLHLHVLRSEVAETNTRSAAALNKQGYRPAGRMRRFEVKGGVYRDMLVFDVLRDDWLAARDQWRAIRQRT